MQALDGDYGLEVKALRPDPVTYSNPTIRPHAYYTATEAQALTRLSKREFECWAEEITGPKPTVVGGQTRFLGAALLRAQELAEVTA